MEKEEIKTREEAIMKAVQWQNWQSEIFMSIGDVVEWYNYFSNLASKFDLVDEFKENGII